MVRRRLLEIKKQQAICEKGAEMLKCNKEDPTDVFRVYNTTSKVQRRHLEDIKQLVRNG